MREVLVAARSGGGVVRLGDGSVLVVADVTGSHGWPLGHGDRYRPALVPAGQASCVVGGLLPPGAVAAEVVDDRGARTLAVVANGAYFVVLDQRDEGAAPVVCCRGRDGAPVSRPPAAGHPGTPVKDADVACPACGELDFEEYLPFDGGSSGGPTDSDGNILPQPIVRCRVCGHDEQQPIMVRVPASPDSPEPVLTREQLIAKADAMRRESMWRSIEEGVRTQGFLIFVVAGWPARVTQSGSEDDGRLTYVTIAHFPREASHPGTRIHPELTVTTERDDPRTTDALDRARLALRRWARPAESSGARPSVSDAASTLRHQARRRHTHAAALNAVQSEQSIEIAGQPVTALMLTTAAGGWAVAADHDDLAITATGHDLDPQSLSLEPVPDPVTTFGPPFVHS